MDRMNKHFGNMAPFQHHSRAKFGPIDQDQAIGDFDHFHQSQKEQPYEQPQPFNEPVVSHQVFVKQPRREDPHNEEFKDPDVWDAPTPKPAKKKSNWGGAARNKQPVKRGAGAAGGAGHPRGNPMSGYGNVDN